MKTVFNIVAMIFAIIMIMALVVAIVFYVKDVNKDTPSKRLMVAYRVFQASGLLAFISGAMCL